MEKKTAVAADRRLDDVLPCAVRVEIDPLWSLDLAAVGRQRHVLGGGLRRVECRPPSPPIITEAPKDVVSAPNAAIIVSEYSPAGAQS